MDEPKDADFGVALLRVANTCGMDCATYTRALHADPSALADLLESRP